MTILHNLYKKAILNNYSIRLTSSSQPLLKLHCYCHHHFLPDHYHLMKSNLDQRGIATPVTSDQINIRLSTWIVSTYTSFIFQVILSHCMYKQTKWCCKQCWLVENNPIPKHCLLSQEQVLKNNANWKKLSHFACACYNSRVCPWLLSVHKKQVQHLGVQPIISITP